MIDSKDISVIVQGAINLETKKTLSSIKQFLPDAEIILSTWKDSNIEGLCFDKVIFNKDPGATLLEEYHNKKIYNNMNRQLLSTQSGLNSVNRMYTLKLRSDLILTSNVFLEYFEQFQKRNKEYKLFKRKILTSTLFTRYNIKINHKRERVLIPFHISDWWFFGLTDDMKTYLSDTILPIEPDFTNYFNLPENRNKKTPYLGAKFKFAPEQYFGYECFSRNFDDIKMEDASDYNEEINKKSQICIVNNFIVLESKQSGIYLNKYLYSKNEKFAGDQYIGLYNFYRYEIEYKKYCDPNYAVKTKGLMYKNDNFGYALLRLYKHIFVLIDSNSSFLKRIEQIFVGIPISLISLICILLNKYKEKFCDNKR